MGVAFRGLLVWLYTLCLTHHRQTRPFNRGIPTNGRGTHHRSAAATGLTIIVTLDRQVQNIGHNLRDLVTLRTAAREANTGNRRFGPAFNTRFAGTKRKGQALDQGPIDMRARMKVLESDNAAPTLNPGLT